MLMEGSADERLDFGKMGCRCKHYRRRYKIPAPSFNEVFSCRHFRHEAMRWFTTEVAFEIPLAHGTFLCWSGLGDTILLNSTAPHVNRLWGLRTEKCCL